MKIAMALENFSPYGGGVESYAVELGKSLIREGWEVHFFGHSWDGEPASAVFHHIRRLPRMSPPSWRLMNFALRHKKMVRLEHFDVVLGFGNTVVMNVYQSHGGVHFLSNMRKLQGMRSPLFRFIKLLGLFLTPKYHVRSWIESAPFRAKDRPVLIGISDMVRDDISSYFRVPKEDIMLVYNGIEPTRFSGSPDAKSEALRTRLGFNREVLFLFMAYDLRKKGIHFLVEAAARLGDVAGSKGFGVVVVGGPPYPSLTRLVNKLKLSKMITFVGPTKEPETYYRASDVFVLPTFYDACSLVIFEAMAAGKPVITTTFNGASGVISDGVEGVVLSDPKDVSALSQAMERFLDREFLSAASQAARKRAADYTLENNHRQMMAIFDTLRQGA
jgi:UDP-glucose:(heptosyl)LPS alpha-1,3-glucosyltransferase